MKLGDKPKPEKEFIDTLLSLEELNALQSCFDILDCNYSKILIEMQKRLRNTVIYFGGWDSEQEKRTYNRCITQLEETAKTLDLLRKLEDETPEERIKNRKRRNRIGKKE